MKAGEVQTQATDIWQNPNFINIELFSAMFVFNYKYYNFLMANYFRLQYEDI
jgi:hypothetical protein